MSICKEIGHDFGDAPEIVVVEVGEEKVSVYLWVCKTCDYEEPAIEILRLQKPRGDTL